MSVLDMSRLETRRTLSYIYTFFSSECPFGVGVSCRRPPFCLRGAPTVLKGEEDAVRRGDKRGNTPLAMDVAGVETAEAVRTPGGRACCMDGNEESAEIEAVSGTSSGGADEWRLAWTD